MTKTGRTSRTQGKAQSQRRPYRWLGWGVVGAGLCALAYSFDILLMRWRLGALPETLTGSAQQIIVGFRDFAQIVPIAVTLIIVGIYDRRRRHIIAVFLLAQILAGCVYNGGKFAVVRYRPNSGVVDVRDPAVTAADTWGGWQPARRPLATQSFPSGHSAAAFAFAGVMAFFYPRLRWLLWTLAVGCAVSRFIDRVHWPSDCVVGAIIGYLAAAVSIAFYRRYLAQR